MRGQGSGYGGALQPHGYRLTCIELHVSGGAAGDCLRVPEEVDSPVLTLCQRTGLGWSGESHVEGPAGHLYSVSFAA